MILKQTTILCSIFSNDHMGLFKKYHGLVVAQVYFYFAESAPLIMITSCFLLKPTWITEYNLCIVVTLET